MRKVPETDGLLRKLGVPDRLDVCGSKVTPREFGWRVLIIFLGMIWVQFTAFLIIFGVRLWNILPVIVVPVIYLVIWMWFRTRVTDIPTATAEDPAAVKIDGLSRV